MRRWSGGRAGRIGPRIVLAAAEGTSNKAIAAVLDCHPVTVGKWRRSAFAVASLQDEHDHRCLEAIVTTLEEQPPNATHFERWQPRSGVAAHLARLGEAAPRSSCRPARSSSTSVTWPGSISTRPTRRLCCAWTRRSRHSTAPRRRCHDARRPRLHDYIRHGTTNLYAALDVASGCVITEMTPRHRARSSSSPHRPQRRELAVHVVLDNVSTSAIQRWLQRHPRPCISRRPQLLDEPRGARAHQQVAPARHAPQRP